MLQNILILECEGKPAQNSGRFMLNNTQWKCCLESYNCFQTPKRTTDTSLEFNHITLGMTYNIMHLAITGQIFFSQVPTLLIIILEDCLLVKILIFFSNQKDKLYKIICHREDWHLNNRFYSETSELNEVTGEWKSTDLLKCIHLETVCKCTASCTVLSNFWSRPPGRYPFCSSVKG